MKFIWVPSAWLASDHQLPAGGWAQNVLFSIDEQGCWASIESEVSRTDAALRGAEIRDQPAIAPLVNAHSHAFQRAFAGFAERRESAQDDFWSWRDRMYHVALAIDPTQMKCIAKQLCRELLRGGYTHVCEFHYLHHDKSGAAYDDPLAMSIALIEAASEVGIGITLLPVVYERSGFDAHSLRSDQRRFRADAEWVLSAQQALRGYTEMYGDQYVKIGAALHSLRAVTEASVTKILQQATGPIHIHIAEQAAEVEACVAQLRLPPLAWLGEQLKSQAPVKYGVHLVHGIHSTIKEINAFPCRNKGLVICPTTEANLGDGIADVSAWLGAGFGLSIGSDSHVCRDWREELRLLEYGQRLTLMRRNVLASPERGEASSAARLYNAALAGGAAPAGFDHWGFTVGARADMLLLDANHDALLGVPQTHWLDAMIFASSLPPFRDVMVAGEWVIEDGETDGADSIRTDFVQAMRELHG